MTNEVTCNVDSGDCCCYDGCNGVCLCTGNYTYNVETNDNEVNISITIRSLDSQRAKDCEEGQTKEDEEDKED